MRAYKSAYNTVLDRYSHADVRRPVLTREQLTGLAQRIIGMTTADTATVKVRHTARIVSRIANGRILSSDDGDELLIAASTRYGSRWYAYATTNQLDDTALRALVTQCEAIARSGIGYNEQETPYQRQVQDTYIPVQLWHDTTINAIASARGAVIPDVLDIVTRANLVAAGFLGIMARAEAFLNRDGCFAFSEQTDSELTVTARGPDGNSSGWAGQSARDWTHMQPRAVAERAVDLARRSANPVALEPGRRTAILSPAAVLQMIRFLGGAFNAFLTDFGGTPFSRHPYGNKLGQRMFDTRISMSSSPADPDGGFPAYFDDGYATPPMQWVEGGVLKNLAYGPSYAMVKGKAYAAQPWSIRLSGGTTTIDEMIARCAEGIYVNRLSGTNLVDPHTGLISGVTRDGCFFIKEGKIVKPVKNFRFLESPFFFLNKIEALGVPERATYGYTPKSEGDPSENDWPRQPIIVPPMMVRDFNFSSLADAV